MSSTFCDRPWVFRTVHITKPLYKMCCISTDIKLDLNYSIEDQPRLNQIKDDLQNNKEPYECRFCFEHERNGLPSYRTSRSSPGIKPLQIFEIQLENTCNFHCASCSPVFSSKWQAPESLILRDQAVKLGLRAPYSSSTRLHREEKLSASNQSLIVDNIYKHRQSLTDIVFIGGEPSIIPQFYDIIEEIKNIVNKETNLLICTNGSMSDAIKNKFMSMLENNKGRNTFKVSWSADAAYEIGEFLRAGLNYIEFKNNFRDYVALANENHNLKYSLAITTSSLNLKHQIDLVDDIFSDLGSMEIKPIYLAYGDRFFNASAYGKFFRHLITDNDLNNLYKLSPFYYKGYNDYVRKLFQSEPDIDSIVKGIEWVGKYSKHVKINIPTAIQNDFDTVLKLINNEQ